MEAPLRLRLASVGRKAEKSDHAMTEAEAAVLHAASEEATAAAGERRNGRPRSRGAAGGAAGGRKGGASGDAEARAT